MKNDRMLLARKYARAFLNLFGKELHYDDAQKLIKIADFLENYRSPILLAQFKHSQDLIIQSIQQFFTDAGLIESCYASLISSVASENRLLLLPLILRAVYKGFLQMHTIMHFTIESALPLTDEEVDSFVVFLKMKTRHEIHYTLRVNPDLLAGVKIYSDTFAFEYSLQRRLYELIAHTRLIV